MTGAARGAGLAADPAEPAKPADLADPAGPASPADPPDLLRAALAAALQAGQPLAGTGQVQNLHRLSGGASQETWAFDWLPAHPAGVDAARSLSGLGIVGCNLAAAVHFSPAFCPIALAMGLQTRQKLSSLGPNFASTPRARQAPRWRFGVQHHTRR